MTQPHLSALMVLSLILAVCGSGDTADPVVTPGAAPTIPSINPAKGFKGVASGAKIVMTFSRPMDQLAAVPRRLNSPSETRQCLDRWIDSVERLRSEVEAWPRKRNQKRVGVKWRFTTDDARRKLPRL